jgi:hypothetical protein
LVLFRADARFAFNAKAPGWLNPRRSVMVIRRVIDAAFAAQSVLKSWHLVQRDSEGP